MNLEEQIASIYNAAELGQPVQSVQDANGNVTVEPVRMGATGMDLQIPLRNMPPKREAQSLEQTKKDFLPSLTGLAGGTAVGTAEGLDLVIGLFEGAYKAAFPDADQTRFQGFLDGVVNQFETGYGEGARQMLLSMGEKAGYDEQQLKVMDEAITVGSFFGAGGAAKTIVQKGVPLVRAGASKAGDLIEGAGDAAKARMVDADSSFTAGMGVDPDPAIAAAGDAVKAMRGGDGQFLSLLEKDVRLEYPDVDLDIYGDSQKGYTLSKIIVPKEKRKQGIGEQVMGRIVNAADQEEAVVKLTPSKDFGATSTARLKKFYKKFGFVENKGRYKDFSIKETMYRLPVAKEINASIKPMTDDKPGIIAFHGSSSDFDEFKLEKIGTGEGAQAYGYGLYFTDSEDIARFYRDSIRATQDMAGKIDVTYKGKPFEDLGDTAAAEAAGPEYQAITGILERMNKGQPRGEAKKDIIKVIEGQIRNLPSDGDDELTGLLKSSFQSELDAIRSVDVNDIVKSKGKMYKVAIEPKPEDMLDYQATFADQPKKVQDALKAVGYQVEKNLVGQKNPKSQIDLAMRRPMPMVLDSLKGRIIDDIKMGKVEPGKADKILSEKLLEQGVPGIKYRAAGSRAASVDAADAEMNYVVFDDKMIKILEKYGIVGPVAIGAVTASQQEGEVDDAGA